jgi:hypothetical protein
MYVANQSKMNDKELNDAVEEVLKNTTEDSFVFYTRKCFRCGQQGFVVVNVDDLDKYEGGALIQEAFPEMPMDRREQMVSGIHPECWKEMFGSGDE